MASPMSDRPERKQPLIIDVDATTLMVTLVALLLIPLLLSGFIFQ